MMTYVTDEQILHARYCFMSLFTWCWQPISVKTGDERERNLSLRVSEACHDDVIKWKHFPRNWPFVREIHRSPVNFPHKGQWRGALMFSLIYAWINDWVNNREAGDLRRQHGHYDVIVMLLWISGTGARWNVVIRWHYLRTLSGVYWEVILSKYIHSGYERPKVI